MKNAPGGFAVSGRRDDGRLPCVYLQDITMPERRFGFGCHPKNNVSGSGELPEKSLGIQHQAPCAGRPQDGRIDFLQHRADEQACRIECGLRNISTLNVSAGPSFLFPNTGRVRILEQRHRSGIGKIPDIHTASGKPALYFIVAYSDNRYPAAQACQKHRRIPNGASQGLHGLLIYRKGVMSRITDQIHHKRIF
jgi:hypothetical protein